MLRVVLPCVSAAVVNPIPAIHTVAIAAVDIGASIRVVHESVVVVNVDVVVAAPSGVVSPASTTPSGANRHAHAKANGRARDVGSYGRIDDRRIGVNGRTVHHRWVIARNVYDLWVRLLNHDDALVLHHLRFHYLLFRGFQGPRALGLRAHALDCVHDVALLG